MGGQKPRDTFEGIGILNIMMVEDEWSGDEQSGWNGDILRGEGESFPHISFSTKHIYQIVTLQDQQNQEEPASSLSIKRT